ncbi:MAG: DUF2306 domain-containing protein [Saprospiraceae bacterium]|nr:DUF2306 domain-containing protein [Saprospiraceae bacterium]
MYLKLEKIIALKTLHLVYATFLWVSLSFFWYLMFRIIVPYTSGETDIDFLLTKQHIIGWTTYRWSFYLHIFSSLWVLASGLTQFSKRLLRNGAVIHRWVGRVYVGIVLLISAPAACVMSVYANGNEWTKASFLILSILWWVVTYLAYRAILRGDILSHKWWMYRSFALTLSAITLRILQFGFAMWTDIEPERAYEIIATPSWVVNLLVAEMLIYFQKRKNRYNAFESL